MFSKKMFKGGVAMVTLGELLRPEVAAKLAALVGAEAAVAPAPAAAEDGVKAAKKEAEARRRKARKKARREARALKRMLRELLANRGFFEAVWKGQTRRVCALVEDYAMGHGVVFRRRSDFWAAVREATRLVAVGQ